MIQSAFVIQNLFQAEHLFKFDPKKESRLGILPRYARNESQIRWFTIPSCMIFHNGTLYDLWFLKYVYSSPVIFSVASFRHFAKNILLKIPLKKSKK